VDRAGAVLRRRSEAGSGLTVGLLCRLNLVAHTCLCPRSASSREADRRSLAKNGPRAAARSRSTWTASPPRSARSQCGPEQARPACTVSCKPGEVQTVGARSYVSSAAAVSSMSVGAIALPERTLARSDRVKQAPISGKVSLAPGRTPRR
jgi:hypothetical protein